MARPRSEEARQKILTSTAQVALDVGIRALTIEEVARRSGVAKTTIYRHFTSKNEMVITALDTVTPVPRVPDTGTLRDDLIGFLAQIVPIFSNPDLRALYLEIMAVGNFDPDLAALQRTVMEGRGTALATIIERARVRGELDEDLDIDAAFEVVEGPLILRGLLRPELLDEVDLEELVDTMIARLRI